MNLFDYEDLIKENPMHIATVNSNNNPNLSVASDVRVYEDNKIIISVNEMNHTQKNIEYNSQVVLTVFNKEWVGLRIKGTAKFYTDGEYYDFCNITFFGNGEITPFGATRPKGALVITVETIEDFK